MPKIVKSNGLMSKIVNGFTLTSLYRYNSGQPFNPTQPLTLDGNTGDTSFCDATFNGSSVGPDADTCRLVLSNPKAPLNTVAYLNPYTGPTVGGAPTTGTPAYVEYNSDGFDNAGNYNPGTPTTPSANHWIINNQAYANAVGNPYPGEERNIQVGDDFSELDATIIKDLRITERVNLQLSMAAFNALNQMYRGSPGTFVANPVTFGSYDYSSGANIPGNTTPSGTRFVLL